VVYHNFPFRGGAQNRCEMGNLYASAMSALARWSPVRLVRRLRSFPTTALVVVTVALCTDSFLYAMVIPLTPKSPAGIQEEWALGVLFAGYALGMMLATPIFGILSDRFGRRRPLIGGVLGQAAATLLFAFAPTFPLMLLARLVQGIAAAATWTAGLALIAENFTHKRTQMMGIAMMGSNAGSVLGPVVGGFLGDWGGYRFPFAIAGGLVALDGLMRIALLVDPPRQVQERPDLVGFFRDRCVLLAGLVVVMGVGGWGLLEPLFPHHLLHVTHASPGVIGLLFTLATLFYGFTAPVVDWVCERWGLRPTMAVGLVLMALSLPLVALPRTVFWAGAALTLTSILYAFALNPTFSELADAVDRRGTGGYASVYAIYNLAYAVGMIGSDVFAGVLTSHFSFWTALLLTSLLMLCSVPLLYFGRPRVVPVPSGAAKAPPASCSIHLSGDPS
jgi:DHA1 family solute carrier family 18 vesicular amine transporter 1/2